MYAKDKKTEQRTIIIVACVIFAVLLLIAMIYNLVKLSATASKKNDLQNKLAKLETEIARLEKEIEEKSDTYYIDKYAREYLDMVGKDETVYIAK